jgi:hypothetical protein
VSRPSFAAGKLDDALTEAFLAIEEGMKEPDTRPELFCLSKGGSQIWCRLGCSCIRVKLCAAFVSL